jgi:serine/threonine-protein kinase
VAISDSKPDVLTDEHEEGQYSCLPTLEQSSYVEFKVGDSISDETKLHYAGPLEDFSNYSTWAVSAVRRGGMGLVYIITDGNRYFALKCPLPNRFDNPTALSRFFREAVVWTRLAPHENIVRAHQVVLIRDRPHILMDYVEGWDLDTLIRGRRLAWQTAVHYAVQICAAMDWAHVNFGIVHRDLKPSNVMIDKHGVAKITDFGLAKAIRESLGAVLEDKENIVYPGGTAAGIAMGTKEYMSPEQFVDSAKVDIRSDIYSFGIMLYEMITGVRPFLARSFEEALSEHRQRVPRSPTRLNTEVPQALEQIVLKCMEKDPRNRYHDFGRIHRDLMDLVN